MSLHDPATVSMAVEIAIESAARTIDTNTTLSDDRLAPLRTVMTMLCDAGITDHPGTRKTAHKPRHLRLVVDAAPIVEIAATMIPTVQPVDAVLAAAPAYRYAEHERPNARGLPILSAAGHPSHTARLTDPMTPGNDTAETHRQHHNQSRSAAILAQAAPRAVTIKNRKARKLVSVETGIAA